VSDALERAAWAELDRRLDPDAPHPLAVAVSGGGDSMALLRLTDAWAARVGRPVLVLTVDHGLHPDSTAWSRFVVEQAAALGRAARVLAWTGDKPATGLPAAAREARHRLLAEAAREAGARVILLGHTADDQAESEWMRANGSTLGRLRDWAPSPAWPEGRGLMLHRPWLGLSRAELRAWLGAQGVSWIDDPANADLRFARSRARAALAGSTCEPVSKQTVNDGGEAGIVSAVPHAPGALSLNRARLLASSRAGSVLSVALLCAAGGVRPPRGASLARLLARLGRGEVFIATLAGARIEARGTEVLLGREPGHRSPSLAIAEVGRPIVWDSRFEITPEEEGVLRPAGGQLSRLPPPDRRALLAAPPWVRGTVPVLETADRAVRLAPARALAAERLALALDPPDSECGL
jgi:tRNA(Ile)-lysidine synthase